MPPGARGGTVNLQAMDPTGLLVLLAGMSLLPLMVVCTTCFLKVSVVLMIVRNAIGVQQVPPSIVVYALALSATVLVMMPVGQRVAALAQERLAHASRVELADLQAIAEPLRGFMVAHTVPEHRARFRAMAQRQQPGGAQAVTSDTDYAVLLPAFVTSELTLAFKIGFALYVPFVVIDLLLSNLLLALGMQMVSPMVLSAPIKILLFVMLDGWTLLTESLVQSYAAG